MFVGGLAGGGIGGAMGDVGETVGLGVGTVEGMHAADGASGLPARMLVGVSATSVYGCASPSRHDEPRALAFQVARAGLTVKVHQRANVRVLELIHEESGSKIELEGNRLPMTHSNAVIEALSS